MASTWWANYSTKEDELFCYDCGIKLYPRNPGNLKQCHSCIAKNIIATYSKKVYA